MAAAPKTGSMNWVGARSGRAYNLSVYVSDVAAAPVRFSQDGAAGAGTPDFWIAPEDVILADFSIPTGLTDTTVLKFFTNDTPTGQVIQDANHVNTLATRARLGFGARAGRKITFIQG